MSLSREHGNGGRWTAILLFAAALTLGFPARASEPAPVPELMNYQGLVYLVNGSTEITGVFDIEFRLYDSPTEGNLLWAERIAGVQVVHGRFNIMLGAGTVIDGAPHGPISEVFRQDTVYIEFKVGDQDVVKTRQRYVTTPHAFSVQNAHSAVHGVPPGTVMPFAGATVPFGWLACDGTAYAKSEYPALYAALCSGGACIWGEDADTFQVPNLGGRALAGADGTHATGLLRGEEKHALDSSEIPSHTHSYVDKYWNGETQGTSDTYDDVADNALGSVSRTTETTGQSEGHNNMQPSAVVKFIVKY